MRFRYTLREADHSETGAGALLRPGDAHQVGGERESPHAHQRQQDKASALPHHRNPITVHVMLPFVFPKRKNHLESHLFMFYYT